MTSEHLIPKALGGRLTASFLCRSCNSKLGLEIEGSAKSDPTIQLLANKLSSSIPKLALSLTEGQSFFAKGIGPEGGSQGRIKKGDFLVSAKKLNDGSLIQDTLLARGSLKRMMQRDGHAEDEITSALHMFDEAPDNSRVMLSPTLEAIKWEIKTIEPMLDGALLNTLVPLKAAFEFLALHVGPAIYKDAPSLNAVRSALTGNPVDSTHINIERLYAPTAKPFHGLIFEGNEPYAKVQVRIFGQLAFRVHFLTLIVGGERGIYTHDLVSNEEQVSKL